MGVHGIEYGSQHARLEELLRSVDRPGDYCVGGRLQTPMPRVVVDGAGELSFPLPRDQIEKLIRVATRAPYGKGTRTIVDTSVRDCRQIDARNVRLFGSAWSDSLAKVMERVARGLGLPAERLGVDLYKLLVYSPGGFFAEHRDTEKVPGMVATLSLSLPTRGVGGELVVRHGGRETTFDMAAREPSELAFAAFYADCLHEVLPVTEGYRVSLVFNLSLTSSDDVAGAPDYEDLATSVAECLTEWRRESGADEGRADKLVWLLDHEYSDDGLSFATLKNTDAAVARVLGTAADRADCELYAAALRIEEYGIPEFTWGGDWGDGDDDVDALMQEVTDSWEFLDAWAARDGKRPRFGQIPLKDSELLPEDCLADAEPDDRRLEESTGNEGPTLEHIYRLATLVVWPRERTVDVLAAGGIDGAVAWAATRIKGEGDAAGRILARLVEIWPMQEHSHREQDRAAMLRLLADRGEARIASRFVHRVVAAKYDGSENEPLAAVMSVIGADDAAAFLLGLVERQLPLRPASVVDLLTLVGEIADLTGEAVWRAALREPVRTALTGLPDALQRVSRSRANRRLSLFRPGV